MSELVTSLAYLIAGIYFLFVEETNGFLFLILVQLINMREVQK